MGDDLAAPSEADAGMGTPGRGRRSFHIFFLVLRTAGD